MVGNGTGSDGQGLHSGENFKITTILPKLALPYDGLIIRQSRIRLQCFREWTRWNGCSLKNIRKSLSNLKVFVASIEAALTVMNTQSTKG
jgi:hypothetical protein